MGFVQKKHTVMRFKRFREQSVQGPENAAHALEDMFDAASYHPVFSDMQTTDPISFPGYSRKLKEARQRTGLEDALAAGYGTIHGIRVAAAKLDGRFLMGSMGTVVGEKLVCLIEGAAKYHMPLIIISASGGARMQEGMFSLLQMAKTSAAIRRFQDAGGLYVSVLTHPTTGGVCASFAMLGDIILAEEGALIGFAGPRVIEQTIGETLPPGFQRAEFQMEHGFVDMVVEKGQVRKTLAKILAMHQAAWICPGAAGCK